MTKMLFLSAVVLLAASAAAQDACAAAASTCMFTFEGASGIPTYSAGEPGTAITRAIVLKEGGIAALVSEASASPSGGVSPIMDDIVGSVDEAGEALIVTDMGLLPISESTCPSQPFSPSFFKATSLGVNDMGFPVSGVSHETPQGDQIDCLDGLCVVFVLKKFQLFTADGLLNIVSSPEDFSTNCAVFKLTL